MKLTQSGTAVPVAGVVGAEGLPWRTDPLFRQNAGSLASFRASVAARGIVGSTDALGTVITPKTSIRDAVAAVAGTRGGGKRILLSEGIWDFPADGFTISRNDVELVALTPGATVFRRKRGDLAAVGRTSLLHLSGSRVRVSGVTFDDPLGTNAAVQLTGTRCVVDDCVFTDAYTGVYAEAAVEPVVRDSVFVAIRGSNAIDLSGATLRAIIASNRVVPAKNIGATSSGVAGSSFVGNVLNGGSINYRYGKGNVASGNSALLNTQVFTLADNTAAATNVSAGVLYFPYASMYGARLAFSLKRGATPDICTGSIDLVINSAECLAYMDAVTTTVSPGILFYGGISAPNAYLQFTSTATGSDATLNIVVEREFTY